MDTPEIILEGRQADCHLALPARLHRVALVGGQQNRAQPREVLTPTAQAVLQRGRIQCVPVLGAGQQSPIHVRRQRQRGRSPGEFVGLEARVAQALVEELAREARHLLALQRQPERRTHPRQLGGRPGQQQVVVEHQARQAGAVLQARQRV